MRQIFYILREGDPAPCEAQAWADWFERSAEERRVGFDERGGVTVSTVFLGLDHAWGGPSPLLYETMVFGGPLDSELARYATRAEAEAGHAILCRRAFGEPAQ